MRDVGLDIAKGIAIYLVVVGHITTVAILRIPIDFTHMPFFFFVSGWFFSKTLFSENRDGLVKFKQKVRRLLLPFLAWSFVALLFNVVLLVLGGNREVGLLLSGVAGQFIDIFIHARSLWFLLVMFLIFGYMLACRFVSQRAKINPLILPILGWLLVYCFVPDSESSSLFCLYKFKWLFPFFIVGCLAKKSSKVEDARKLGREKKWLPFVLLALSIIAMYSFFDERLFSLWGAPDIGAWDSALVLLGIIGYYVLGFAGVISLILVSDLLANTVVAKGLAEIGMISLDVYVIHMFFVKAVLLVGGELLSDGVLGAVLSLAVSVVIVVVIWALCEKCLAKTKPYRWLMRGL